MADIAKPAEKPKWATGGSAAVTTPPLGKQDLGWVVEYPPHQFFNWLAKWTYRWIEYFEAKGDSSLGGAAETTLTLVSGVATPTLGKHRIDTEGLAAADDLTHLAQSGLDDGRLLFIRSVNAGRVVTVKHLAGGTGEINLRLGADLVLDNPNKWLLLTRNGTQWVEVMASFLGADPAPHLGANLDVRARKITTSTTSGDVVIEPNGTGALAPETSGKALGKSAARWAAFLASADVAGNILPDATGKDLGSSVKRWDAFLSSIDLAGNAIPDTNGTRSLGTAALRWVAFLASADVAGNILPDSDSARDLGATGTRWDEIFGDFGSFTSWVRTASIDSEGSGGTLNIGDVQAALINIGRVGATIALHGSVTEVHTTNTFVQDKLLTFNDGGLAGTGSDSGFEIEEGSAAAGWVKTSDGSSNTPASRETFRMKAPARAGEISHRAPTAGLTEGHTSKDEAFDSVTVASGETHNHFNLSIPSGKTYSVLGSMVSKDPEVIGDLDVTGDFEDISPKQELPAMFGTSFRVSEEIISYAINTISTLADTEFDVAGADISLGIGVWDLSYVASCLITRKAASVSSVSIGRLRVTTAGNVPVPNTSTYMKTQDASLGGPVTASGNLTVTKRIEVTTPTTYKLRATSSDNAVNGEIAVYNGDITGSITGEEMTTYIRAVRVPTGA